MARRGKISIIIFLLMIIPFIAAANTITINDPFPGTGGDVIGHLSYFDIQKATLDFDLSATPSMDIGIYFNYKGSAISGNTINTYNIYSVNLSPGDILFGAGGTWKYGIALSSRSGSPNGGPYSSGASITKGAFYKILDQNGVLTAHDVLQNNSLTYRKNESVWLYENSPYLDHLSDASSFNISNFGDGSASAEYLLNLTVPLNQGFINDLSSGLDFHYAIATCGNDILDGKVQVPEPLTGSLLLLAGGFIGVLGLGRKKFFS